MRPHPPAEELLTDALWEKRVSFFPDAKYPLPQYIALHPCSCDQLCLCSVSGSARAGVERLKARELKCLDATLSIRTIVKKISKRGQTFEKKKDPEVAGGEQAG